MTTPYRIRRNNGMCPFFWIGGANAGWTRGFGTCYPHRFAAQLALVRLRAAFPELDLEIVGG